MRTRRIAIGCRRTGRSATVAITQVGTVAPAELTVPSEFTTGPEFLTTAEFTGAADLYLPPDLTVPGYLADPGPVPPLADPNGRTSPGQQYVPFPPFRQGRPKLTAHHLYRANAGGAATGRDWDWDWNHNPGWPVVDGRTHPTGRSPRHARINRHRVLSRARRAVSRHISTWTGAGLTIAIVLSLLANAVSAIVK